MNIPRSIKITSIGQHPKTFEGQLAVSELPCFASELTSPQGEIKAALTVTSKPIQIDCTLETEVILTCQRCMQPYHETIHTQSHFVALNSIDELDNLRENEDPVIIEEGNISIFNMIEEELLLSIPIIPLHPEDKCPVKLETLAPKPSQFDILTSLKN